MSSLSISSSSSSSCTSPRKSSIRRTSSSNTMLFQRIRLFEFVQIRILKIFVTISCCVIMQQQQQHVYAQQLQSQQQHFLRRMDQEAIHLNNYMKDPSNNNNNLPGNNNIVKEYVKEIQDDIHEQESTKNKNNLTAVIHIGPQKTGSKTIQRMMEDVLNELKEDGYEIVPDPNILASYSFAECFKDNKKKQQQHHSRRRQLRPDYMCHEELYEQTYDIGRRNMNLLSSSETYTNNRFNDTQFGNYLHKYWTNVRIVTYYRRFYSWLASYHNQHYKFLLPASGDEIIDWLTPDVINGIYDNLYVIGAVNRSAHVFGRDNIQIYNFHNMDGKDLTEVFYCDGIPNAHKTCTKVRQLLSEQQVAHNTEQIMIYKELVYYAKRDYLIKDKVYDDKDLYEQIKYFHEITNGKNKYTFTGIQPECPTDEILNLLLTKSLNAEKELFPEFYNERGHEEIISEFELYKTTKLCTIRGHKVLEADKEHWTTFFQTLL